MCLPTFKYHPNAYQLDIFVNEEGICSVCNQKRTIKYNLVPYCVEDPDYICPWCIADGSAAEKYQGQFNDNYGIEDVPPEMLDEIVLKTPSYSSWQQEVWLSHCNEPCAFIGYVGAKEIEPYFDEILDDIQDYPEELIKSSLSKDGALVGYLFECVQCAKRRLHVDCD
jgi:uncharacterized protein